MADPIEFIRRAFPKLGSDGGLVTSLPTTIYNCIAWAAGDAAHWWWPVGGYYWPAKVPSGEDPDSFVAAFRTFDYEECQSDEVEEGFEKVAFFVGSTGRVTHGARQLPEGDWTSKLGESHDIRHPLRGIEGATYGTVVRIMRRRRRSESPASVDRPEATVTLRRG